MAANIFEIILNQGFTEASETNDLTSQISNPEFNDFEEPNNQGQTIPDEYTFNGLSDISGLGAIPLGTSFDYNLDFTEGFSNSIYTSASYSYRHQYYRPQGWDVKHFSVGNVGVIGNSSAISTGNDMLRLNEVTTAVDGGIPHLFNGGGGDRLISEAFLTTVTGSPNSDGRIPIEQLGSIKGAKENFEWFPSSNSTLESTGVGRNDYPSEESDYSVVANKINLTNHIGLNCYEDNTNRQVDVAGSAVPNTDRHILYKSNESQGITFLNTAVDNDGERAHDLVFLETKDGLYADEGFITSKYPSNTDSGSGDYQRKFAMPPVVYRIKNIFNKQVGTSGIVKRAESTFTFNFHNGTTPTQALIGAYTGTAATSQFSSSALSWTVNSGTGAVTGTTFGKFYPSYSYFSGEAYNSMTSHIEVSSNRLHLKRLSMTSNLVVNNTFNLSKYETYRVFFDVVFETTDNWFVVVWEGIGTGGNYLFLENFSGGTNNDRAITFDTTSATTYTLSIGVSGQGNGANGVSFNKIRFESLSSVFTHTKTHPTDDYHPFNHGALIDDSIGYVITTSNFYANIGLGLKGEGQMKFAVVNDTNPTTTSVHTPIDGDFKKPFYSGSGVGGPFVSEYGNTLTEGYGGLSIIDNSVLYEIDEIVYLNPYAISSFSGEPLLQDESTAKFYPSLSQPKDAEGFYSDEYFDVTTNLRVDSEHINVFVDSQSSNSFVDSTAKIGSFELLTNYEAWISRDGSNDGTTANDKIRLYYDNTIQKVPPPNIEKPNVFNDIENNNFEVTIAWDFDSMSSVVAGQALQDYLKLDYGEGTSVIATITPTNLQSSVTVVPEGHNLRLRVWTEEEKGAPIVGVDAVFDAISGITAVATSGPFFKVVKHGDEASVNQGVIPNISEYDAAVRVISVDNTDVIVNASTTDLGTPTMLKSFNVNLLKGSGSIDLFVNVLSMAYGSELEVIEQFSGNSLSTTITSVGTTQITRNTGNTELDPDFLVNPNVSFIFHSPDAATPLDIIITSLSLQATFPTGLQSTTINLDLDEDFEFPLNVINKNFEELSQGSGNFTKTLQVPATSHNKRAILFQNEINTKKDNSFVNGLECTVKANGLDVFNGKLFYDGSEYSEHGEDYLNLSMIGGNSSWADLISNRNLRDLVGDYYRIMSMWTANLYDNAQNQLQFPLIDNGAWGTIITSEEVNPDRVAVGWPNIKCSYRILLVLEKIFNNINYSLDSDFFGTNQEWNQEFGFEFNGFMSKIIGIAPTMQTHEDDVKVSELNIRMNNSRKSMFQLLKEANTNNLNGLRPSMRSVAKRAQNGDEQRYYVDWCFLNFDETHVNGGGSTLETQETTGANFVGGVWEETYPLINSTDPYGQSRSVISVNQSGFYTIQIDVNADFNTYINGSMFSPAYNNWSIMTAQGATAVPRLFSVALVDSTLGNDGMGNSNEFIDEYRLAALMFDLKDESAINLGEDSYDNTRISLQINQYLSAEKEYAILAMEGIPSGDGTFFMNNIGGGILNTIESWGTSFKINEVVLRMSLSQDRNPMEGYYDMIYDNVSPTVSYREVLPDVSQLDFVSEISKMFNLVWATNELTKQITVEPLNSFYDFNGSTYGYLDWDEKALIVNVEENGFIKGNLLYAMNEDSSDWCINNLMSSSDGGGFGDKKIYSDRNINGEDKWQDLSLSIFSAMKMDFDYFLQREFAPLPPSSPAYENMLPNPVPTFMPKIWHEPDSPLTPTIPEEKPRPNNSHQHKLAFILDNAKETIPSKEIYYAIGRAFYPFSSYGVSDNDGLFGVRGHITSSKDNYMEVASYSPFNPEAPNVTFSDALDDSGGLFQDYHKSFIDSMLLRDKKITAEVHLTPTDIANINFRQLIHIDGNYYILSRIVDYNFSGETTQVELILATTTGTNL